MDKIYKSELSLLRFVGKSKKGRTVDEAAKFCKSSRQSAYGRLERAVKKELLDYRFENGVGSQQHAVYTLSEAGREVVKARWVREPKRTRTMVRA